MDHSLLDQQTKQAWEKNWETVSLAEILEIFRYRRVHRQLELFCRVLPKDQKILEGGCGLAPYLIRLRQLGYDVEGVDYNAGPINKALSYDPTLPVRVGDVTCLDYPDEHFGGYLSLGVIEHFSDGPERAIAEAHRVLKKGGVFVVAVPVKNFFMIIKEPFRKIKESPVVRRILGRKAVVRYWEQYFKREDLTERLTKAGFTVREVHALDHDHALISCLGFLRDPRSYDEAGPLGRALGDFLARWIPWSSAGQMTFVAIRK